MPKLFDLLSEQTDKDRLIKLKEKLSVKQVNKSLKGKSHYNPVFKRQMNKTFSTYIPDFVAIDVETTGLNAKRDRIIEIGVVKVKNRKVDKEFSSLINPCIPIPLKITGLTGIADKDVDDAPVFKDIIDDLLLLIGHKPICGHQIDFDFNFINAELKSAGQNGIRNSQLDTVVLSRLLLSGLPGYSLSQVSKHLGIPIENFHRALCDARASSKIALKLIPMIDTIPLHIRKIIGEFAPYSMLKTVFINSAGSDKNVPVIKPHIVFDKEYPRLRISETHSPIDKDLIKKSFSENRKLSQLIDGYSSRPSQIQMALSVTDALNRDACFIAEAASGTGKSMAYLVPAAFWSLKNNTRVLISTYTKNLQDQLISKDLPVVKNVVGKKLKYSVLKGRANYICKYQWNRFLSGELGNVSLRERMGILPLIRWVEETKTGDIEEQNFFNIKWFARIWSLISAEPHNCHGRRCPFFNSCFLQIARKKALSSHIVVVNHALFFADVCSESSFLGKIGNIIFDEAHNLESCGHRYLRVEIDTNRINRYAEFLNNLLKIIEKCKEDDSDQDLIKNYKKAVKRLRKSSTQFLSDIVVWTARESLGKERLDKPEIFQFAYRDNPFGNFPGLAGFRIVIRDMQDTLFSLKQHFDEREDKNDVLDNYISAGIEKTSQLKSDLVYLTNADLDDHVFWIEGDRIKGWIKLCGVPLDIGEIISSIWKKDSRSVVFTSATMSVSGMIDYFKRGIGLVNELNEKTFFETFGSPFSREQMYCSVVKNEFNPDSTDYSEYVADTIIRLFIKLQKNILVLFTANTMLYNVYNFIKSSPEFPKDGTLLAQGLSGTRSVLLESFKESEKCVLLGTGSFWEGIDAPGAACEIVVIPRLPFPVPTHPLRQALAERIKKVYGDSFYNFSVPEAVIKFRQGAGRLIRTGNDIGVFIVLDSRLITKAYGKIFIQSIESDFVSCMDVNEMINKVTQFFNSCKR